MFTPAISRVLPSDTRIFPVNKLFALRMVKKILIRFSHSIVLACYCFKTSLILLDRSDLFNIFDFFPTCGFVSQVVRSASSHLWLDIFFCYFIVSFVNRLFHCFNWLFFGLIYYLKRPLKGSLI